MSVIIKEPVTGFIVGEVVVESVEQLRKLEKDFVVLSPKKKGGDVE